ncbi:MAG: HD domain-containing protein [Treponema sp.]|nr:HD domain-containing protein [Candidatus Treponema scatequi]
MLNKKLVLKIFEAFSIERWNDLIRPFDLIEMDKAAEKMVLAYILGKFEESAGRKINWTWMINASFFDLLKKIALCDIKAPVQALIKQEYPSEYMRLNEWVLNQYRTLIDDDELFSQFTIYIGQKAGSIPLKEEDKLTSHVYQAAHKYSTIRELEMIKPVNETARLTKIEQELNRDIQKFLDLRGLQLLTTKQRPYEFLLKIEQLRFQRRWNQTPRIPNTSVLGHCYFVAISSFLLGRQNGTNPCEKRIFNNFFSALFHDLPEAVTRDIISPVKQATDELPSIVKHIEDEIVNKELVPLMENFYADELMYFTNDEFENRIIEDGQIKHVSFDDLNSKYNSDQFSPVDGKLVRLCDHASAFLEADISIKHGITSRHLEDGRNNTLSIYKKGTVINGIDAYDLFTKLL